MASASQSTGHSESQSTSDTYIPEYSESPFLRATAELARQRSNEVYQWGIDTYNKNQGSIDSLMRDALSYASPQRIAVDMGMAEAGVQQAGERGRLSAIRDLESYGIDPSSGRYAALDSANRVMTAAAAAGAGNQQRMATQAAGNAMRNQALSASLQNANFGSQANRDANAFLNTAMSLKYPPLGRTSQSTSRSDQQSSSGSGDGGGSKGGGDKGPKEQQPKEQQPKQPGGGGGQPRQSGEGPMSPGLREPPGSANRQLPPLDVKTGGQQSGAQSFDEEGFKGLGEDPNDPNSGTPISPPADDGTMDPNAGTPISPEDWVDPNAGIPISEDPNADSTDPWGGLTPPDPNAAEDSTDPWGGLTPPGQEGPADPGYDPYANPTVERAAFDPVTGESTGGGLGGEQVAEADPAGNLYGWDEGGGWTGTPTLADYSGPEFGGAETWSDIGQGTTYDSTYDTPTDVYPGGPEGGYLDENGDLQPGPGFYDDPNMWGDGGDFYDDEYGDLGGGDQDWTGDIGDDQYGDLGDYEDPYADWGEEDYYDDWGDYGDYEYDDPYADWGEEDYYDDAYGDLGDEDYYEDYGDDYNPDDYYEDYGDDYDPGDYYEEDAGDYYDDSGSDYYDDSGGDYEDSGGDYEYEDAGDYAAGGPVKPRRQNMRPRSGGRSRRPATGYGQRPPMRRPPPGAMPGAGQLAPPPRPPGGAMRLAPPPQPPRPVRGAPMPARGGPQPAPRTGYGQPMPGNFISANGMPPPTTGGMPRPQRMANGGGVRSSGPNPQHATSGGFVSRELSPSGGSQVDDVQARLNAEEFVIPKDVAMWKGKEFFYKMIAQARKNRSAPNGGTDKAQTGYGGAR